MIELRDDSLVFSFPQVHPNATCKVDFQRTLRIPDDDRHYPLPPGLGRFPLCHVDDFQDRVPADWTEHGGVMLPMYQSEAMWLRFSCGPWRMDRESMRQAYVPYPFAIKIATGKINAVSGQEWQAGLNRGPQDYVVAPDQPWLDGYMVGEGVVRQFVAMPLGSGYSAEEQLTGRADVGGLQLLACPLKAAVYQRLVDEATTLREEAPMMAMDGATPAPASPAAAMGLAPGGRMRQQIYADTFRLEDWDVAHSSRCFVHIANSLVWRAIARCEPPGVPPTAKEYTEAGLPWFDYYADQPGLSGSTALAGLKSVFQLGKKKADVPLPENESVDPRNVVALRRGLAKNQVREGSF